MTSCPILLATLNARFAHTSLGLRYLHANMRELQDATEIVEYTIQQGNEEILENLVIKNPKIIGFGVYIWNVRHLTSLIQDIKILLPETVIVLGGPEISHEYNESPLFLSCDHVITGWGDTSFYELCKDRLERTITPPKIIIGKQPPLTDIHFPYHLYRSEDLKHRTIYVEASRGCPFICAFCLSSLDKTAWTFPLDEFLQEMELLYNRGLRQFKFVDRTFNLKPDFTNRILQFFLEKISLEPDDPIFLHFELVPDFLSKDLKDLILKFPSGSLQFEIGIQTFNLETQGLISRRTDLTKAKENILWLSSHTDIHLHIDLIAGLPAEDLASFAKGFNELWSWKPHEIQLGILKRLKGIPLNAITENWGCLFSSSPPYSVFQTASMDYDTLNQMKRAAKYWDLIANSGRFKATLPLILDDNAFMSLWDLSNWLYAQLGRTHSISLDRLFALMFTYLTDIKKHPITQIQALIGDDFIRSGSQGWPRFLGEKPEDFNARMTNRMKDGAKPKRQQMHD